MALPFLSRLFAPALPAATPFDEAATLALAQAVFHHDLSAVDQALLAGPTAVNINAVLMPPHVHVPRTLLQHAVANDEPALVQRLLLAGADPMLSTSECFWPAAHLATLLEHQACLIHLINDGRAQIDLKVVDPVIGEASSCRDLAARRKKPFADWFGQFFSLSEAARPPHFEPEEAPLVLVGRRNTASHPRMRR